MMFVDSRKTLCGCLGVLLKRSRFEFLNALMDWVYNGRLSLRNLRNAVNLPLQPMAQSNC